jgi:hypothetical protein
MTFMPFGNVYFSNGTFRGAGDDAAAADSRIA